MKRKILYSLIGLFLLIVILPKFGLLSVQVSPYYHHRLNEIETQLFDNAILNLREKVEAEKFDEIQNEIAEGRVSKKEIIANIKKSRRKFGKPLSSEFFRSSLPESASKYYENLTGTFYSTSYLTNTDDDDFVSEQFDWIVKENNEVQLLNYSGKHISEWQLNAREKDRENKSFQHEIRIPFGARFIEIRY